jgi:hypothetical protein
MFPAPLSRAVWIRRDEEPERYQRVRVLLTFDHIDRLATPPDEIGKVIQYASNAIEIVDPLARVIEIWEPLDEVFTALSHYLVEEVIRDIEIRIDSIDAIINCS